MKKIVSFLLSSFLILFSCSTDKDDSVSLKKITLSFSHHWDGTEVNNTNFNNIQYTNENGEQMSITKLRYLISRITFHRPTGEIFTLSGYNLVDVTNNSDLLFTPNETIPTGDYNKVTFTFGFNNDDNYNANYQDLNTASWSVPAMLGGGYHYMQLEGKFIDNTSTETGYSYHAIRAVDNSSSSLTFQDTFFEVNLGAVTITNDTTFNIQMNIAEWFKTPNTWDLNALHAMLMPNFNAQVMIYENGQNVFNLQSISP